MEDNLHQKPAPGNHWGVWILAIMLFLSLCIVIGGIVFLSSAALIVQGSVANATDSANATATSAKKAQIATLMANSTPTPPKFNLVDTFASNQNGWTVGKVNDQFWVGESKVENGAYAWNVQEFKNKSFLKYSDFSNSPVLGDFDVSVDVKIISKISGTCSGIIFRKSALGWEDGGYLISVCKDHQFFVGYLEKSKWLKTSGWTTSSAIKDDWNRIEINVRGSKLICKINDFIVYEMDDSHQLNGNVALFIEVHGTDSNKESSRGNLFFIEAQNTDGMTLLFDNFNLQEK